MRMLMGLAVLSGAVAAHAAPKTSAEDFAMLDLDKNGTLDWKEYSSRVSEIFFFADADNDGRLDAEEAVTLGEGVAIREGGVSHDDFLEAHRKTFNDLDRDGDGRLTQAEASGG